MHKLLFLFMILSIGSCDNLRMRHKVEDGSSQEKLKGEIGRKMNPGQSFTEDEVTLVKEICSVLKYKRENFYNDHKNNQFHFKKIEKECPLNGEDQLEKKVEFDVTINNLLKFVNSRGIDLVIETDQTVSFKSLCSNIDSEQRYQKVFNSPGELKIIDIGSSNNKKIKLKISKGIKKDDSFYVEQIDEMFILRMDDTRREFSGLIEKRSYQQRCFKSKEIQINRIEWVSTISKVE